MTRTVTSVCAASLLAAAFAAGPAHAAWSCSICSDPGQTSDAGSPGGPSDAPMADPDPVYDPGDPSIPAAPVYEKPKEDKPKAPKPEVHLYVAGEDPAADDTTTVDECDSGERTARIHLRLDHSSSKTVTADWSTADGTATAGEDYVAGAGQVSFSSGETDKVVTVGVSCDTKVESDEDLRVVPSNVSHATLVEPDVGVVIIRNDDHAAPMAPAVIQATSLASPPAPASATVPKPALAPGGTIRVPVSCPAGMGTCRGTVSLTYGTLAAGHLTFTITEGQTQVLRVPLSSRAKRLLARHRRLGLVAHLLGHQADGRRIRATGRFTAVADDLNPQPLPPG